MEESKKCIKCGHETSEFTVCRTCRGKKNQQKFEKENRETEAHDNRLRNDWLFEMYRRKYCVGCLKHKLLRHFDFSGVSRDGYTIRCKLCMGKESKPKWENNRNALQSKVEFYSNFSSKVEILDGDKWVPMPEKERLEKLEQAKEELQKYLDKPSVKTYYREW